MKRWTLRWMIGLMTLALLGLIGFQWYWIDSVIRANEERFRKDVMEALNTVSEKLEKQEALYTLHRNFPGQTFFTPPNPNFRFEPKSQSQNMMVIKDTIEGEQFGFNIIFDFEANIENGSVEVTTEKQWIERHDREREEQVKVQKRRVEILEERMERATKKSEMMFQVLENMLAPERPVLSRLNPRQLDSLLSHEFSDRGIDISFNYGVVSPVRKRFVLLNERKAGEELARSELRSSLFPNDLVGEQSWLVVDFPNKEQFLLRQIWLTMASSGLLVLVIVGTFGYSIRTILRQKKLSEMKNDFINNMTHELKTPIATISLACEALSDKEITQMKEMRERYLKVIGDENRRLGEQVERVLQMAAIDRNDVDLKREVLDIGDLVNQAVEKTSIQIEAREGTVKVVDNATEKHIYGDPTHLENVLVNLLDNANKYSPETPDISIRLYNKSDFLVVSVQDRGIGITREAQNHIFQKFYRVPTGNIHNVKGFGLGLAYVKNMVELHDGTVSVESEPGKGSKFSITLPIHGKT